MAKTTPYTRIDINNAMNNSEVLTYTLESFTDRYSVKEKRNYTLKIYKFKPEDYITISLTENKLAAHRFISENKVNESGAGLFICINAEDSEKRVFGYNSPSNYIEFARVRNIIIIGYVDNMYIAKYDPYSCYAPFSKQCFDYIHNAFKEFDYYYFYSKTADAFGFLDFNAGTIKYESKTSEVIRKPDISASVNVGDTFDNLFKGISTSDYSNITTYECSIFVDLTKINNLLTDSCKQLKCHDLFSMLCRDDNNKPIYLTNANGKRIKIKYTSYSNGTHGTLNESNVARFYKTTIDGLYLYSYYDTLNSTNDYSDAYFYNSSGKLGEFEVLNYNSYAAMKTPNNAFNDWFINIVVPDLYYSPAIYETKSSNSLCLGTSHNFTTVYDIGIIMQHYVNDYLNGSIEFALVDSPNLEEPMYLLGII